MRSILHILVAFFFITSIIAVQTTSALGNNEYIHYNKMMMQFTENNATVTIYFKLNLFAQTYVFFMGSHNLNNDIKRVFSQFDKINIDRIGKDYAIIRIYNITTLQNGYYLHDSKKFETTIDELNIIYPSGLTRDLKNANETPNIFY